MGPFSIEEALQIGHFGASGLVSSSPRSTARYREIGPWGKVSFE
jgi:hypothetical protein